MRSRESVLPPLWDQQTYVQKAEAVWSSISKKTGENPLSIEPSVRPPGTVLLTAPIGQLSDFRNFYFRSAFVPVGIMALAVFVAGVGVTRQPWESALLALLAASMPMFWQFDYGGLNYFWGLVDTFQASLGALAMAGFLVAAVAFKRGWIVLALSALALLPLIKPTGFLIGAMVSFAWFAVAARYAGTHRRGLVRGWIGIVSTGFAIVLVLGGMALASFNSKYFSFSNIEFGKVALAQLRGEWFREDLTNGFTRLFSASIGLPLLIGVAIFGVMAFLRRENGSDAEFAPRAQWMAVIGMVVVIFGVAITYQATLFRQARYFFPVIAVAIVLFVPILVLWIQKVGKFAYAVMPVIPLSLLIFLFWPSLNGIAFSIGGYGLKTGYGRAELKTANTFIERFRATDARIPMMFTTSDGLASYAFEAAFVNRLRKLGITEPEVAKSVIRPFNWVSGGVVSIGSIYNADLLAIERRSLLLSSTKPMTYSEELYAWKAWLEGSPNLGSTEVVFKSPSIVVLAVKDRSSFERQMRQFIASRSWRPEFLAANRRSEYGPEEVIKLNLEELLIAKPVDFGNVVRVHALSMSTMPGGRNVNVDIFSEYLGKNASRKSFFFIHQLDSNGKIISNQQVELPLSRLDDRPVSRTRYKFIGLPKTVQIGVGVYESGGSSLVTNWTLAKDWGGRRAKFGLLSLPSPIGSEDSP